MLEGRDAQRSKGESNRLRRFVQDDRMSHPAAKRASRAGWDVGAGASSPSVGIVEGLSARTNSYRVSSWRVEAMCLKCDISVQRLIDTECRGHLLELEDEIPVFCMLDANVQPSCIL